MTDDRCGAPTTAGHPCKKPAGSCPHHTEGPLTTKQQRFVEEYTVDFNATQAAIRAGYSENTAHAIGWENLRKPEIADAVQERLDALAMSADEALKRLADWGRGDPRPFLRVTATGEVLLDLSTAEAQDNLHLLRKIKVKETRKGDDLIEARTEIELHDAKDAVIQLAKIHGLFVERVEHSGEITGVMVMPDAGRGWDDDGDGE